MPESNPGRLLWSNGPEVKPGGNRIHAYLDVLAPDEVHADEIEETLTGLWLSLIADEAEAPAPEDPLPNPLVYRHGDVVLRFGVERDGLSSRAMELADLQRAIGPAITRWFAH